MTSTRSPIALARSSPKTRRMCTEKIVCGAGSENVCLVNCVERLGVGTIYLAAKTLQVGVVLEGEAESRDACILRTATPKKIFWDLRPQLATSCRPSLEATECGFIKTFSQKQNDLPPSLTTTRPAPTRRLAGRQLEASCRDLSYR